MKPVQTEETNFAYLGDDDDVADLPCYVEWTPDGGQQAVWSTWEPTELERKAIRDGANISIGLHTTTAIPPMAVVVDDVRSE